MAPAIVPAWYHHPLSRYRVCVEVCIGRYASGHRAIRHVHGSRAAGCGVRGLWFRVQGSGFRVQSVGLGFPGIL
eukprot:364120-Rhodomonas_salina.1